LQKDLQGKQRNSEAEEELLVVSNSSVIIAFARICRLDLLGEALQEDSRTSWREVTAGGKPGREKILGAGFIHVKRVGNRRLVALFEEFVDEGEAEAIVLALEFNADLLLVDDRDARSLAKKLGLQVMGTPGVLALAKYRGLIQKVKPIIDELIESGFWISSRVLKEFLRELGEY